MIPLFIGLSAANLFLMVGVFILGTMSLDTSNMPTFMFPYHQAIGVAAGLVCTLTHVVVYTYFMATTKWLRAATDKANLDPAIFIEHAASRKRRSLPVCMLPIVFMMLAMFAGAGSYPHESALWPREVHLVSAILAIAVNLVAATVQYILIRDQNKLMDGALQIVNRSLPA